MDQYPDTDPVLDTDSELVCGAAVWQTKKAGRWLAVECRRWVAVTMFPHGHATEQEYPGSKCSIVTGQCLGETGQPMMQALAAEWPNPVWFEV